MLCDVFPMTSEKEQKKKTRQDAEMHMQADGQSVQGLCSGEKNRDHEKKRNDER